MSEFAGSGVQFESLNDLRLASSALVALSQRVPASEVALLCKRLPRVVAEVEAPFAAEPPWLSPGPPLPAPLLTCSQPFADYCASSAPARAVLLLTAFQASSQEVRLPCAGTMWPY